MVKNSRFKVPERIELSSLTSETLGIYMDTQRNIMSMLVTSSDNDHILLG